MAINKKLIHFNKKATFNSQKLSANDSNTQYQVGGTGTVQTGAPDINYQSIVYIKDSKEIWTHGQFYGSSDSGTAVLTITGSTSNPSLVGGNETFQRIVSDPYSVMLVYETPATLVFTYQKKTVESIGGYPVTYYYYVSADDTSRKRIRFLYDDGAKHLDEVSFSTIEYVGPATSSALGGVKVGYTTSGKNYKVQLDNNNNAYVYVPWTDTTYSLPTASASTLGGVKVGSGLSISNGVLSTGNYVSNVEAGLPSTDWQSAYVPLTISYRDGSTSMETISLPMATGDGGNGSAGLMSGADKKKLDGFSGGVPSKIENGTTSVTCTGSDVKMIGDAGVTIGMVDNMASILLDNAGNISTVADGMMTSSGTTGAMLQSQDTLIDLNPSIGIEISVHGNRVATFKSENGHGDITIGDGYNYIEAKSAAGTGNGVFIHAEDGVFITGEVSATGGFFDTSDARVKTNVKEIDASNADKVRLVEFDRTDKEHHGYGVIAQELEKVYPEMVNTDDEGFKSVNYNELAMVKIKYLEDKVARLEALVGRLLAE